jgi:intracellular sulfur oxidation DsrE/DsrF family protein
MHADRRDFIARLTTVAAAVAFDPDELRAGLSAPPEGPWDTSWIPRVERAKYRVVFNTNAPADGAAFNLVSAFLDGYAEVHATKDDETRAVVVFRQMGTVMALNDEMWSRYGIGASRQINDPATGAPAVRNVFWKSAPDSATPSKDKIEPLHARGMISLVCNVSLGSIGYTFAKAANRDVEEVRKEVRANLVPGAIIVPSGIYALIRAQNAGCAFMQGT